MSTPTRPLGVHSEAGKLRKVLVCSPGLAHQRLTLGNAGTRVTIAASGVHYY